MEVMTETHEQISFDISENQKMIAQMVRDLERKKFVPK